VPVLLGSHAGSSVAQHVVQSMFCRAGTTLELGLSVLAFQFVHGKTYLFTPFIYAKTIHRFLRISINQSTFTIPTKLLYLCRLSGKNIFWSPQILGRKIHVSRGR
jgi:hypothetical protein